MNPDGHWAVDIAWLLLLTGMVIITVSLISLFRQWRRR